MLIPSTNAITYSNQYGTLIVEPDISKNLITQTQYANFTSNITNSVDIAFRFDFQLTNKDIWMWKNISHYVKVFDYGWIQTNYTLVNISDFELTDEPDDVDFGDIPSDYYAVGNASYWDEADGWWNDTFRIGFDSWSWLNPEHTECNFSYTYWGIDGFHYETQFWFDWDKITHLLSYQQYKNKHYYYYANWSVQKNKEYRFKWQYDTEINSQGKWDLLAKLHRFDDWDTIRITLDPWWDANYANFRKITVESDSIDATLTNFPLLVVLDNSSGDYNFHNSGGDIEFVSTDNTTQFNHEIESFDNAGNTFCWVNISEAITSGSDYSFLVYYDNGASTTVHNDDENVWHSSYICILHLNESSGNFNDSTSNDCDASAQGDGVVRGAQKIGNGVDLAGSDDYARLETAGINSGLDEFTAEGWINLDSLVADRALSGDWYEAAADQTFLIFFDVDPGNQWRALAYLQNGAASAPDVLFGSNPPTVNNWYYLAVTVKRNDFIYGYENVTQVQGDATNDDPLSDGSSTITIGIDGTTRDLDGSIDEIRFSNIARNASWIRATFNSTNQTDGFLTIGAEKNIGTLNSNPFPADSATGVEFFNHFNITLNSGGGYNMNTTWRTNESGDWLDFNTTSNVASGTYYAHNTTWVNETNTKYWWSVNTSDGHGNWDNDTYSFTVFDMATAPVGVGWELVSLPKNATVNKLSVYVRNSTNNYTWQQAVDNGIIVNFLTGWDVDNQLYDSSSFFRPYEGYWMYFYDTGYDLWINGTPAAGAFNGTVVDAYLLGSYHGTSEGVQYSTPGFELVLVLLGIGFMLLIRRKKNA